MFRKYSCRLCPPARKRSTETWSGPGAVAAFMFWIAARTLAGKILGGISPVGITGFDTGVDERKRLV
ncbi:unnamed protein product [Strongylus vulgaris]|uniref:Uncharacterized protein n=1 Tax=Strongylus vulgaris TaxID=40348 RepID=A0A3P7L9Y2_STRVU|nr:unnamed protein product [Strongylus vulgaris]